MKKFFQFAMALLAISSSAVFTSCGDDDDEITSKHENLPYIYQATVSEDFFKFYDAKVTLYYNNKSKEVTLNIRDAEKDELKGLNAYTFIFDGIDGVLGIDSVRGKATIKADAVSQIQALPAETALYFGGASVVATGERIAPGKYKKLIGSSQIGTQNFAAGNMLIEHNGSTILSAQERKLGALLTAHKPGK